VAIPEGPLLKKIGVIGHEYPGIAFGFGFWKKNRKPFYQVFKIFIVIENPASLYPSDHDMMQ
jgi:hypothetical protein